MCCSKKLNKRGSFFVEYALILAFVVICGTALLSNNEISLKINNIITSTTDLLQKAAASIGPSADAGEQTPSDTTGKDKVDNPNKGSGNNSGGGNGNGQPQRDDSEVTGTGAGLVGQEPAQHQ